MLQTITQEELDFVETLCDPIAVIECAFSDLDNLTFFDEERFSNLRLGQIPMLSFEYFLDYDKKLEVSPVELDKANFKLREGAGTVYCFGGRKFGKTLCVEKLDLLVSFINNPGEDCGFCSYDHLHIRGVLEDIIQVLTYHPFFSMFEAKINRSPTYRIFLKNGYKVDGVNMNISSSEPGGQFFQKHFKRLYIEEASFETEEVNKKRLDSISENGCVFRIAGMTNFTRYSPAGKIFYEPLNMPCIVNLPQYVNPKWDSKEKEDAIRKHSGEDSISYRVFVKGEIVEDGVAAIDMERVRKNYDRERAIKHIELSKDEFGNFENILIAERPKNAENLYLCADIGESAPTEIIVIAEVDKVFKYIYNITLYNLTDKEQSKIFIHLGKLLQANYIGLDCTDGTGRAIYHSLEEVFPKENLAYVSFNEKIQVDFERDEKNNIIFKDGKPVQREEYTEVWSIKRLRDLLYEEGRFSIPLDYKFDSQLNSVIATHSGNRILYPCVSPEDHMVAAWKVFFITQWENELVNTKAIKTKNHCKIGV